VSGRIDDLLRRGRTLSFEFFPPRTEAGVAQLGRAIEQIGALRPDFVSVTYGAGGSTRELTASVVTELARTQPYPAMPHLTCIGHTRDEVQRLVEGYASAGIRNLLALAGDPPEDGAPAQGDFTHASDLVELLRDQGDWCIGVAAFPEGHPRSTSLAEDRTHLARKLELADFGITQFFFRAEDYLRMVDDLDALGCRTPVLPGIIPMVEPSVVRRFAAMNAAWFPEDLAERIEALGGADRLAAAAESAAELASAVLDAGAPGLHLYSLNRAEVAVSVVEAVGDRLARST